MAENKSVMNDCIVLACWQLEYPLQPSSIKIPIADIRWYKQQIHFVHLVLRTQLPLEVAFLSLITSTTTTSKLPSTAMFAYEMYLPPYITIVSYPDPHSQLRMDYITATSTKVVLGICNKKSIQSECRAPVMLQSGCNMLINCMVI